MVEGLEGRRWCTLSALPQVMSKSEKVQLQESARNTPPLWPLGRIVDRALISCKGPKLIVNQCTSDKKGIDFSHK